MEEARLAGADDRPACLLLLTSALAELATLRGGAILAGQATAEGLLDRWMAPGSSTAVYVGQFAQAVVGILAVSSFSRPGTGTVSGRIECCYVETGARGVGVGAALLAAALSWCAAARCADVDALALPGDRSTKQRLEAAGFTARLLTLNRRLD
ncbi:MAG TPA: GNAT family N-acetyltransferase [Acidimicrobiales bacterium]|nr:GNAT family N-acetyltransferase [Acidimicrobiales bacterium]